MDWARTHVSLQHPAGSLNSANVVIGVHLGDPLLLGVLISLDLLGSSTGIARLWVLWLVHAVARGSGDSRCESKAVLDALLQYNNFCPVCELPRLVYSS